MKKYVIMLAVMLSLVAACKKRGDEPQPTPSPTPTPKISGTVELEEHQVEFFASADNSRLDQYLKEGGAEEEGGMIDTPFLSDRNIMAWFFVRGDVEEDLPSGGGKQIRTVRLGPQGKGMAYVSSGRVRFNGTLLTPKGAKNLKISAIVERELPKNDQDKEARQFVKMVFKASRKTKDLLLPEDCYFRTLPFQEQFIRPNSLDGTITAPEVLPNGRKIIRTNIPYIVFQKSFTLEDTGTQVDGKPLKKMIFDNGPGSPVGNCLMFRPSGMLLRFRIENNPYSVPLKIKVIELKSNILVDKWYYDFYKSDEINIGVTPDGNEMVAPGKKLKEGYFCARYSGELKHPDVDRNLIIIGKNPSGVYEQQPLILAPGQKSPWFYTWVMPLTDEALPASMKTTVYVRTTEGRTLTMFVSTSKGLNNIGSSVPMKLRSRCKFFSEGYLPLDFVAKENLKQSGNQWVIDGDNDRPNNGNDLDPENSNNQLFREGELTALRASSPEAGRTIDGKKYYIPTELDWSCIFPALSPSNSEESFRLSKQVNPAKPQVVTVKDDIMRVGGPGGIKLEKPDPEKNKKYRSFFVRGEDGNVYALRLVGGENCHILAYRYIFKEADPNSSAPDAQYSYVKVLSRTVNKPYGADQSEFSADKEFKKFLAGTVAKPEYWSQTGPGIIYSQEVQLPSRGLMHRGGVYREGLSGRTYYDRQVGSYFVDQELGGAQQGGDFIHMGWKFKQVHNPSQGISVSPGPTLVHYRGNRQIDVSTALNLRGSVRLFRQGPPRPPRSTQ